MLRVPALWAPLILIRSKCVKLPMLKTNFRRRGGTINLKTAMESLRNTS